MLSRLLLKLEYMAAARRRLHNKGESLRLLAEMGWRPDVVIDVGAGYGTAGLMDAWPETPAILIEPQPALRDEMEKAAASSPSVTFLDVAIGARPGTLTLSGIPVEVKTLDQIVSDLPLKDQIRRVLLKIDVDGPECDVIEGAAHTLSDYDCVVILECVLHDGVKARFTDIVLSMREHGYEVSDILEALYRPHDDYLWQVDCLFTRADGSLRAHHRFERAESEQA
jgi:hypothetical protein